MLYSFSARGATKDEVKASVAGQMQKVVEQQSIHNNDSAPVLAATNAFIDALDHNGSKDISVSVCGSVSWRDGEDDAEITAVNVDIDVKLVDKV